MDTAPPGASGPGSEDPYGGPAMRWRHGWVFAAVWLFFLVDPFTDALRARDRAWGAVGMAAVVAFGVLYIVLWRRWQHDRSRVPVREAALGTAALLALAALVVPGAGSSSLNALVFVCAYAVFALPTRVAAAVVGVLVVATAVVGATTPGWGGVRGTAAAMVLATVAVFGVSRLMQRTRQLAVAQQDLSRLAVAEERSRFARDLHDLLGHSLTVITLKAELAGRLVEADDPAARARAATEVADVERLARDALADVRAALAGYREVSLGSELAGARSALAAAGIEAHLPGAVDDVPAASRELFGWVVREGVTNVIRHSGARRCWVELSPDAVAVCDDGAGPRPGAGGGAGLSGLADRAAAAGGTLTVGRSSAGGFSLRVQVAGARADREDRGRPGPRLGPGEAAGSSRPVRRTPLGAP